MAENQGYPETENAEDREIVLNRSFNAPRELVWEAWSRPEHLANWWGPRGFKIASQQFDFKPGGVWKFTMHGPDGVAFPNQIVFVEMQKPERLVYATSDGEEESPGQFQTTVTFREDDGGTSITMRLLFKTAAERDHAVREYGAVEGGKQTLDRLAELLALLTGN
ncbi:SRPBCC family protein [Cohnella algarum]|uniref:SRPBCC family protein n=1 Tax=Cohnella algarum TaxID=2044859 RepID=UPI001967D8A1|nr:SRPBCC family protein [Cohnella algarum]MBN2980990.1 SRPBCC family protein [Cohnella algarum]